MEPSKRASTVQIWDSTSIRIITLTNNIKRLYSTK